MLRFNYNTVYTLLLKYYYFFLLWGNIVSRVYKFQFFMVNFYIFKGFIIFFKLLNSYKFIKAQKLDTGNILNSRLTYNNSLLIKKTFGTWNYYLKWLNGFI